MSKKVEGLERSKGQKVTFPSQNVVILNGYELFQSSEFWKSFLTTAGRDL